ncbi:NTP transferase domain-containing protein [bacterium]|nr:NTP transferase domain-containing protein [bacterium]
MKPLTTIILAAGKGTRMEGDLPKVLHRVGGIPMVAHVINTARLIGSDRIIVVIGYRSELVRSNLANLDVDFVVQKKQFGTGHAVLSAQEKSSREGTILVLSGDVPLLSKNTLEKLLQIHYSVRVAGAVLSGICADPTGYGRIVRSEDGALEKIVEEKDATIEEKKIQEVNAGIYTFQSQKLWKFLPKVKNLNKQNEYYLPDIFSLFRQAGEKMGICLMDDFSEASGVNTAQQLKKINEVYHKKS